MNGSLYEGFWGKLEDGGYGPCYDWVDPNRTRTPEKYPYSFDAHWLWRKDLTDADPVYSDRMWEWDSEKARKAFGHYGQRPVRSQYDAEQIIEKYYCGRYECVGYALCCNASSGYEIGIFYVKSKKPLTDTDDSAIV